MGVWCGTKVGRTGGGVTQLEGQQVDSRTPEIAKVFTHSLPCGSCQVQSKSCITSYLRCMPPPTQTTAESCRGKPNRMPTRLGDNMKQHVPMTCLTRSLAISNELWGLLKRKAHQAGFHPSQLQNMVLLYIKELLEMPSVSGMSGNHHTCHQTVSVASNTLLNMP